MNIEAVVVWTKADPSSPGRFVTGVRTYAEPSVIDGVLAHLQTMKRTTRIEELRSTDRFDVVPALEATWNGADVRDRESLRTRRAHRNDAVRSRRRRTACCRFRFRRGAERLRRTRRWPGRR